MMNKIPFIIIEGSNISEIAITLVSGHRAGQRPTQIAAQHLGHWSLAKGNSAKWIVSD